MKQDEYGVGTPAEQPRVEMLGLLREPMPGQHWMAARQPKVWRPPTDVYETDSHVVVKVEIAGMADQGFDISLKGRHLTVRGTRIDPAAKLAYQQMEVLYGPFETDVHLPRAIDEDEIEATYQNGFLSVFLLKSQPRRVPITKVEDAS